MKRYFDLTWDTGVLKRGQLGTRWPGPIDTNLPDI